MRFAKFFLRGDEDGRVVLFGIGIGTILVALILVVAAGTQIHLERMRLATLAGQLARVGANAVDEKVYREAKNISSQVRISNASVSGKVNEQLRRMPHGARPSGVKVVSATTIDERTARVSLRARIPLPLLPRVLSEKFPSVEIDAIGTARAG